ncbi:MAG: GH92 family glycosyl hydrolase, partial [Propionicimonas sp.]|nr:GH92 family glycosyl hydrolase [Propionicimonas sp.]
TSRTGASLEFPHNATVTFQTAMSYVSADGADANLAAEASSFDGALAGAQHAWADQLGKVEVTQGDTNAAEGERETQLRTFYSALYRSFLAPNIGSDVDGSYRGWDGEVHSVSAPGAGLTDYYQNFSLWDTYRTQQQWLYLTEPLRSQDMAKSLVLQSEQSGWTPRWGYGPVETNVMTGDPATPFLVSAWDQGLLPDGWAERAYAVLTHNADSTPNRAAFQNGRAGNASYLDEGYVPHNTAAKSRDTDYDLDHGGSATLEYALADATLAHLAQGLGHSADAARFALRGQNFRSLWDPDNDLFRTRDADGAFLAQTDASQITGFHEGTSSQYTWLVQQDIPSLIDLLGGKQAAEQRLDAFFAYDDIDLAGHPGRVAHNTAGNADWWVNGTYSYYGMPTYNPNNEPDLHAPYVYLWLGEPGKTSDVVREALTLFTDSPNGVTGNDDLGTMAAWQVLSTIGIYPIIPGSNTWGLTTPVFDKVAIDLDQSFFQGPDELVISAQGVSAGDRYTRSVKVGGADHPTAHLRGEDLVGAGTLDFAVGSTPSSWATAGSASPGSLVDTPDLPTRLVVSTSGQRTLVAAGESVSTTVSLQVTGTKPVSGKLAASTWSGISVSYPSDPGVSLSPRGGTVMGEIPVVVTVDEGVQPGSYPVVWTFGSGADAITATTSVSVPDVSPLAATGAFNNKAFGDGGSGSSARFNASSSGSAEFFLRELANASGMPLGVLLNHPSDSALTYVLSESGAGSPATAYDNIVAQGQTTNVAGRFPGATRIAFIVSANNGSVTGQSATLTFTDSTTARVAIAAADWCGYEVAGVTGAGRAAKRYSGGVQSLACGIYATTPVSLDGKSLTSITWPGGTDAARLHILAIASDAGVRASGSALVSGPATYGPDASLTVTGPAFSGPQGISATYQWLRDGVPVSGGDEPAYQLSPQDVGAELSVVVTGRAAGLAPAEVTSQGVTVQPGRYTVVTAPATEGTATVGETLVVTAGEYSVPEVTATYQWLADGTPIAGAVDTSLVLDSSLVGKRISVAVATTKPGYVPASPVTTAATDPVAPAVDPAITVTGAPAVSGTAQVGRTLTATPGTYSVPDVQLAYQWLRNGVSIAGATRTSYQLTATDNGRTISVRVTASKAGWTTVAATSSPSAKVKAGAISVTRKAKVTGTAKVGKTLKVAAGKYSPGSAKATYTWLRNGRVISGATSSKYKLKSRDRGKKISVRVTVRASGYTTRQYATATTKKVR